MLKRMLFLLIAPVMLLGLLTGCGSDVTAAKPLSEIYSDIEKKVALPDMLDLNQSDLVSFMGIKEELYTEAAAHIPIDAVLGDMILIFKAADETAFEDLKTKVERYRSQKLSEMENYIPSEYEKIDQSEIVEKGLYLWLVVSDDADAILLVINENIK